MTARNPLLLDEQLCFAVYTTSLAMTQTYKPLLEAIGLTYPQYLLMLTLWEGDGLTVKELSHRLHQDPGSVTPVLKRLEADGLLKRLRDPADERSLAVTLTAKGRALREKAKAVNKQFGAACALPDADVVRLRDALIGLRTKLSGDASE